MLLNIVETAILDRIDETALAAAEMAEQSERDIALRIAGTSVERLLEAGAGNSVTERRLPALCRADMTRLAFKSVKARCRRRAACGERSRGACNLAGEMARPGPTTIV